MALAASPVLLTASEVAMWFHPSPFSTAPASATSAVAISVAVTPRAGTGVWLTAGAPGRTATRR